MKQYILYVHAHVHVHAVDLYLAGDDVKKGSVCYRKQELRDCMPHNIAYLRDVITYTMGSRSMYMYVHAHIHVHATTLDNLWVMLTLSCLVYASSLLVTGAHNDIEKCALPLVSI